MSNRRSSIGEFAPHYRPDIDGLRALAVLSVVVFHASSQLLPGGYIGVDIFFVISGFLITSIICRNLENDKFSFIDFYARRAKRIFPALIIVLAAVGICGWIVLLPDEYAQLGKHMAAGAGFISNFALWQESGYFDKAAAYKPLLHLWSLGIEEQFYFLWPPFLVWAWRRKANLLNIILTIAAISFVLNVAMISLWQAKNMFYLPPTRFWELLFGAALAYAHQFRREEIENVFARINESLPKRFVSIHDIMGALGLLLLVAALAGLNSETLFPGWWALLPTVSALLLISAGGNAWINRRLLSRAPIVFIGVISYPLYLWHWPLLSYAQVLASGAPSRSARVVVVGISFVLAWLTYRLVEKPVRTKPNHAALILIPALMIVGCFGIASFLHRFHARSEGYGLEKIVNGAEAWGFPGPNLKTVHTSFGYHAERSGISPKVLFLGDSNMEQYYPRIDKLLTEHPDTTRGVVFVTQAACPPIPYVTEIRLPQCAGQLERAFSLAQDPDVDTVVIAASWPTYQVFKDPERRERAFQAVEAVVRTYRRIGRRVYLILPIPEGPEFDPHNLIVRSLSDFGFKIARTQVEQAKVVEELKPVTSRLLSIANSTGATPINPVDFICREGGCPTLTNDGSPIYKDENHLRPSYVREYATFIDPIVSVRGASAQSFSKLLAAASTP